MKFASSITLLKQFVITGTVLTLICISNVVKADDYTVNNTGNSGAGSLRDAITQANSATPPNNIFFSFEGNQDIAVPTVLPTILQDMKLDAVSALGAGNVAVGADDTPLFNISPNYTLELYGKERDGNTNWHGNIVNNGTLLFRQSASTTYAGIISGTGIVKMVGGTLILDGQSTYTGDTYIESGASFRTSADNALPITTTLRMSNGTFRVGDGQTQALAGLTGSGTVTIGGGSTLTLNSSSNNTFLGPIAGTATFMKTGTGTQTLSGVNTDTGTMQIDNGTIVTGNWAGQVIVNANGALTNPNTTTSFPIGGNFQQVGGTLNVAIANDLTGSGQFAVTGNATLNGGTVNVTVPSSNTIIPVGRTFDIITTSTGITPTNLPTIQSSSLFIDFTRAVDGTGNNLQLTATRTPYEVVNVTTPLDGVATGLDGLINNNQFVPVFAVLDNSTTLDEYKDKLTELAPAGLDGIYSAAAENLSGGSDQAFLRLDTAREMGTAGALARTGYLRTGYAAGDMLEDQGSYGPIVFGNSTKQDTRNGLRGYNATTAGFGFLGDVPILEYFRVGLGITYASSAVKQSDNTGSNTKIGSTQGLAYGSATYGPLFFDGVLSAGVNNYHGKHNMPAFGQTATSAYNGFQYGAKAKAGFTIPCYQVTFSPTVGVQYMHLNVGQYTQKGAGVLNQSFNSMQTSNVRVSLGGRIADRSQEEDFFPEIHAFYLVDVKNPNTLITSRFVAGGGSFTSTSVVPPKAGINVGASITALVSDDFVLSGGYDLEAKKSFRSHSASLKFKFLF